jgi:hypothetical protein
MVNMKKVESWEVNLPELDLFFIQWLIGGHPHFTCDDSGYLISTFSDEDTDTVDEASVSVSVTLRCLARSLPRCISMLV